ncbi:FAD:protein FMN transferase [Streptomyces zhihengii]
MPRPSSNRRPRRGRHDPARLRCRSLSRRVSALGTAAVLLVTDPAVLRTAEAVLRAELAAVDLACSRFRPDSELTRVNVSAGVTTTVGEYFSEALQSALRVARLTGGAVDPTVGSAVIASGYDRSFASLSPEDVRPVPVARPAPGWRRIAFDPRTRRLRLPRHPPRPRRHCQGPGR